MLRDNISFKFYNETYNYATSIAYDYGQMDPEMHKHIFFSLINENKELPENDKGYCKERYIYHFELNHARNKTCRPRKCNKCNLTIYSTIFCENCISSCLQNLYNSWTSGSEIVDRFIQKCQELSALPGSIMEWIPFDQFIKIDYLTRGGFGTIYKAE